MDLETFSLELMAVFVTAFVLAGLTVVSLVKIRKANDYKPFPVDRQNDEEITLQPDAWLLEMTDVENTDVDTEVINTMDYHQLPKELVAEKARRLALGDS